MKIFGIGITGLVGSRIVELLEGKYTFTNLSIETGINITDPKTLAIIEEDKEHDVILHLAAKADVEGCEKDKPLGKDGDAYKINVVGTQNIVNASKKGNKKYVYISTDFVFGQNEPPAGGFTEEDKPGPVNWYGETKLGGEEVVKNSGLAYIIMRIAYPYRKEFTLKKDFVRAIKDRMQSGGQVMAITDHLMTPTFIDDIAYAFDKLIETDARGIFHVVGSSSLSPYDATINIAEIFGCDKKLIGKTTRSDFFKGRAPRPYNLSMNNAKITKLGVKMRAFEEGLRALQVQA